MTNVMSSESVKDWWLTSFNLRCKENPELTRKQVISLLRAESESFDKATTDEVEAFLLSGNPDLL